jgi:hypothetical protein
VNDTDVLPHGNLPQLQTRLPLDASQRVNWNIAIGVGHRHQAGSPRVLELNVAASLPNPPPDASDEAM